MKGGQIDLSTALPQKKIRINEANFLNDFKNCDFSLRTDKLNENYYFLISMHL